MDVHRRPLRYDVQVPVVLVLAFVMAFDLSYAVRRVRLYAGDAVVLLCDSSLLLSYFSYNGSLRGYAAFSKRVTHYDTFSKAAKMSWSWALRGGLPLRIFAPGGRRISLAVRAPPSTTAVVFPAGQVFLKKPPCTPLKLLPCDGCDACDGCLVI